MGRSLKYGCRTKPISFRVSELDFEDLKKSAKAHGDGNVSTELVRLIRNQPVHSSYELEYISEHLQDICDNLEERLAKNLLTLRDMPYVRDIYKNRARWEKIYSRIEELAQYLDKTPFISKE